MRPPPKRGFFQQHWIRLLAKRKKNSNRQHSPYNDLSLSLTRNRIESTFSAITGLMPKCIRAKTEKGFWIKVLFFVLAHMCKLGSKAG